jgi:hypothetical protein
VRSRFVSAFVAAAALVVAVAGPVGATAPSSAYANPVVDWVQPTVVANPDGTATVHARYTCSGGNVGTHLYIGIKQGPEINATDHTSSQYAQTFYSTNWNADGPGLALNCNGQTQNAKFVLKPDAWFWNAANAPLLSSGRAFVQFCILDSTNTGEGDLNGFAFDYSMRKVVVD